MRLTGLFLATLLCSTLAVAQSGKVTDLGLQVNVQPLTERAWLIRSTSEIKGFGAVESNALLVVGGRDSVLIDTPVSNEQTDLVLRWAKQVLQHPVRELVVTHWHDDRMGGIDAAHKRHVETYALGLTIEQARLHELTMPKHLLREQDKLNLSGVSIETYFPGHGHTADNIVVWLPKEKILHAGCFGKAVEAKNLGNMAEINVASWAKGVAEVQKRYAKAEIVIPGHGPIGKGEILTHTAALLAAAEKK